MRRSVAERAIEDRSWTYGHVVVDEAQELSPMAWRMLLRRCPSRSFTIVGDVAQTSAPAGTHWWPETMDPLFQGGWNLRELTISYRIPSAVALAAQSFAKAAGLPVSEMSAARDVDDAVTTISSTTSTLVDDATAAALDEQGRLDSDKGGLVAVIAPESLLADLREALPDGTDLVSSRQAKGLEYDAVVIVSPEVIASTAQDLYVALTRPTKRLVLLHATELPRGLGEPFKG